MSEKNALLPIDDTEKTPPICAFCFSTLNSLHKILFEEGGLDNETGEEFINLLINYTRYFNFKSDSINNNPIKNDKIEKIIHIIYQKRAICQISIENLYQLIQPRIERSKSVVKQTVPKDIPNDNNSYM